MNATLITTHYENHHTNPEATVSAPNTGTARHS